jgi:hypothetical protein
MISICLLYGNYSDSCLQEGPAQHVPAVRTETIEWCVPAPIGLMQDI